MKRKKRSTVHALTLSYNPIVLCMARQSIHFAVHGGRRTDCVVYSSTPTARGRHQKKNMLRCQYVTVCKTHLSRREFNTRLVFALLFVQDGNVKTFFFGIHLKKHHSNGVFRKMGTEPQMRTKRYLQNHVCMWCIRDTTVLLTCCVKEWRAARVSTVCAFILSQCTHSSRRTFFNQITTWGGKAEQLTDTYWSRIYSGVSHTACKDR